MLTKSCLVHIKAVEEDGGGKGVFEGIVSVFGNVDFYGDKVMPGAFADTLEEWKASGNPIPVVWSHMYHDPDYHIGEVLEAAELLPEDERLPEDLKALGGLWVRGRIDLDEDAAKARRVHRLLKGRRVTQFSFSYDVLEGAFVQTEDESFYELRKLKLYEVGPTLIGANQETELLAVKAASPETWVPAGRTDDGERLYALGGGLLMRESLVKTAQGRKSALEQIAGAVTALTDQHDSKDGKATASEPASGAGPDGDASEPMHCSPASLRLRTDLESLEVSTLTD